ncbi:unnamed protein product [Pleuronectes platessa]|uniref:Uncharacterized protein n=1 Tax=Pleuronectes platessa TaxID=8262 RepID=A0A9N7TUU9_PLEPL|nr:unnamed protein product [Pleuronectes platessa]
MTSVCLKTDGERADVVEDRKESSVRKSRGQRNSLAAEVEQRQVEVRTYESSEEITLKMQQQVVKDSLWFCEDQQGEYKEAEKSVDTEPCDEEDFDPEDVDLRDEMSLTSVPPPPQNFTPIPSKLDIAPKTEVPPPEPGSASREEAGKASAQERKLKEETCAEQRDTTESSKSVCPEEILFAMEELVKPQVSATLESVTIQQKSRGPERAAPSKQADSVEVVPSERHMSSSRSKHLSPPSEQDLPRLLPKTRLSHPVTVLPPEREARPGKKIELPREDIKNTPEATDEMCVEELSFKEELIQATSVPEHRRGSSPLTTHIPLPEKTVLQEKTEPKKTSPSLPKMFTAPEETFVPEEVTLSKKSKDEVSLTQQPKVPPQKTYFPFEQETLLPASVGSSEETRTSAKKPLTRADDDIPKKRTEEVEQQTLQKGILLFLSRSGS